MQQITKGLAWASAIIAIAIASLLGVIASDVATTLIIVLPILAVLSINGGESRCLSRGERR